METSSGKNRLLVKNTLLLYLRMIITVVISFVTSRLVLNALGVDDFGINNVVGGLVSMFSILSSSLSTATSRFLSYDLGSGNVNQLRSTFSTTINIHLILAVVVVLFIEIFGTWFLNNKMTIPIDRIHAANWVLQCSTISFAFSLLSVPYNAAIIAHERMNIYAVITIIDAVLKLLVALSILYYNSDKLILFSILTLLQRVIIQIFYWCYCKKNFTECLYSSNFDKSKFKSIFSYASWNFIGCTASLMKDQGVNIVLNIFTGPAINAARGIAMQINGIVTQFISNFTISLNPQIIKEYASKNIKRLQNLVFYGTRLSYYLFMFISIPLILEIEFVLNIWLGIIPEYTIIFVRLILILSLVDILSSSLITAQLATGKIKLYQIVIGGIQLLNLPFSYFALKMGLSPEITVTIAIIISIISLFFRLLFSHHYVGISIQKFLHDVVLNSLLVTFLSCLIPYFVHRYLNGGLPSFLIVGFISVISSLFTIYFIGFSHTERQFLKEKFQGIINRHFRRHDPNN